MTAEEKEKLYTAIGYSGSSHDLALPKQVSTPAAYIFCLSSNFGRLWIFSLMPHQDTLGAFTQEILEFSGQFSMKCPDILPAPQSMNLLDLNDSVIFPPALPSGQTVHV